MVLWFRNWGIETKDDEVTGIWILDFGGDNIRWVTSYIRVSE